MTISTSLVFRATVDLVDSIETVVLIGRREALKTSSWPKQLGLDSGSFEAMVARCAPGDAGASTTTWIGNRKVVLGVLPEACSRHNAPSRAWAIPALARRAIGGADALIVLHLDDGAHLMASACAVARAFPMYSSKTSEPKEQEVQLVVEGTVESPNCSGVQRAMDGVRSAARLLDTPTSELYTDAFVDEARAMAADVGGEFEVIAGSELQERGFGGFWGVGKAAVHKPAMVILRHQPEGATRSVAWVGKGIVYDTGGLSIKSKTGMPGMKGDMGGAAAVFGAFQAAVASGVDYRITAVLCLAENAVGPEATRPDDILTMYSGKTVEVNNTDAEGRLVLADGVHWAATETDADLIVDIATLTGAASVATGKGHAAVVSNDAEIEQAVVAAGLIAGEPCFPLVYAPELLRKEFRSKVADMKNSVKNRGNAQSSCAAQFIANHLPSPAPRWLHVDIAGTAWGADGRGTGFGVGLLLGLGAGPEPAA